MKLQDTYENYEINYYSEILCSTNKMSLESARRLLRQGQALLGWNIEQIFEQINSTTSARVNA